MSEIIDTQVSEDNWRQLDRRSVLTENRVDQAVIHLQETQAKIEEILNRNEDPDLRLALQHLNLGINLLQTH